MKLEDSINQQAVGQLYIVKEVLEREVTRLLKEREETGRFLDIDKEAAELAGIIQRKEETLAATETEAAAIRDQARTDADTLVQEARAGAEALLRDAAAQAKVEADRVVKEANQAAAALRSSAESVYRDARQKTAKVDEELAERQGKVSLLEQKIAKDVQALVDRDAVLTRSESAVDAKRSMLRAGLEALRRVLDEVRV